MPPEEFTSLVHTLQERWRPERGDPQRFKSGLRARLKRAQRRRRWALGTTLAGALVAFNLLSVTPPFSSARAPTNADHPGAWWSAELEPDSLTNHLSEDYQTLAAVFLEAEDDLGE